MPGHGVIYTGMAKPYLRSLCDKYKIKLVEILERDDVAIYNSIPTAEGALMMAIQNTDFTIHGSTSMVLGMGRTGFTMARTCKGLVPKSGWAYANRSTMPERRKWAGSPSW